MLEPMTDAAKERAERMQRIYKSEEMQNLLHANLPNNGESFQEISRKGLASAKQDRTIFWASLMQ